MRYLLYSILAGAIAGGAVIRAQQTPPPSEAPIAKEPRDPKPAEEPSSQDKDTQSDKSQEEELKSFTPSEKVPVDSAISFPVDI